MNLKVIFIFFFLVIIGLARYSFNRYFLDEGTYKATILKDGKNSSRIGTDYLIETKTIKENRA